MARVVIVAVCGILMFVLVSKFAPHFLETYLPAVVSSENPAASPDAAEDSKASSEKKKSTAAKAKPGTAVKPSGTATAAPAKSESANPVAPATVAATPAQAAPIPSVDSRHVTRVTAENATVYLTNTGGGPVVGRLAKGAVVEPVFVVSTAGQTWTFVSTHDQEITGFLRSDMLAKTRQADQPSR
jgi:hypothetical protein